jgi:hypothetical protein
MNFQSLGQISANTFRSLKCRCTTSWLGKDLECSTFCHVIASQNIVTRGLCHLGLQNKLALALNA